MVADREGDNGSKEVGTGEMGLWEISCEVEKYYQSSNLGTKERAMVEYCRN